MVKIETKCIMFAKYGQISEMKCSVTIELSIGCRISKNCKMARFMLIRKQLLFNVSKPFYCAKENAEKKENFCCHLFCNLLYFCQPKYRLFQRKINGFDAP